MAEEKPKVEPASGWPIVAGEIKVGDPKGPVAVAALASETIVKDIAETPGVAIVGPVKTENIGIEKVIANVISNPNIRYLIVCGTEVTGHVTGGSLKALYEHGIQPDKRIKNAPGAIPYVEHLSEEVVDRFRRQVQLIDMINVEDVGAIKAKIAELVANDPGAFPEPPMVVKVEVEEKKVEEVLKIPLASIAQPVMFSIEALLNDMRYRVQLIGRTWRLISGVGSFRALGLSLGLALSLGVYALLLFFTTMG
ncbi:MAG: tetrahydromethanopterin S-methyltransferase subunit A [Candidatus Methanomethylicota archaeon]|uniref:Tetrahydromethanopterin S-methyltransferase subunit A n=1 Tax=Thermoproteota archaeon TaxID=2056631 RepID=A0A497EUV1_9CREN|nr:MAG: tetrahydromethanopterin S-methyltransferase subunit A [Candidatus Verstraetearchaeota archaeon]RLE50490.1 MAG: tetrahydromethanopterin S-methyltransferase subunit A [Candidatus Verstraetearchaeota archaeon]